MAGERSLVLYKCAFEDVVFKGTFSGNLETYDNIKKLCHEKVIDYCVYNSVIEYLNTLIYSSEELARDKDCFIDEKDLAGKKSIKWIDAMNISHFNRKIKRNMKDQSKPKKIKKTE